ncbi:O-antigen ligase family protein [Crocosphaera sp. UHCC 0190]|uniref:O-antigen ligase family protein n=1 Tax=Crocosphaera sp. UHCC 0190 TaxID=3110246 RepID=UPI002B215163|nr:O-antigen ligase family protein [Crocosphaera sp. UHCC 0190]MEA5510759.1 O-antigen ligase family protein [Crocosphaera sp. UHCC 0190]
MKSRLNKNNSRWPRNCLKFGVFLLPFSADFGATALVFALFGLWKQKYRQIVSYPFNWALGLLSLWLILTSIFAFKPILSLEGLGNFFPCFLLLAAFPLFFNKVSRLYQLAWWLVLTSIPLCFLGLMQLIAGWESPLFLRAIGIKLIAYGNPDGRMSSLLMYANTLAFYLLITFTLSIGLGIDTYRRWQEQKNTNISWQLGIIIIAILSNSIGLILTNSRSAWGLALLGLMAFALYLRWYWLIGGVIVAIAAVFWAAWGPFGQEMMRHLIPSYFWARLTDDLYSDRYVTALRTTQWGVAWEMMLKRPWLGWGLRNFTPVYQTEMNVWMGHPHNLFLMLLAEIGIPGTLLLSGIVGKILFEAVQLLRCWSEEQKWSKKSEELSLYQRQQRQYLLLFTYVVAFSLCLIFNLFDVSIFDVRVNLPGWILLAAIAGLVKTRIQGK